MLGGPRLAGYADHVPVCYFLAQVRKTLHATHREGKVLEGQQCCLRNTATRVLETQKHAVSVLIRQNVLSKMDVITVSKREIELTIHPEST